MGEQVVLLSLGGNLETAFALPAVYSNQFHHRRLGRRQRDRTPGRRLV
ncbi:phage-related baseplate assembly family protein [Escherichia coli 4-203-08_S1_C3]|nr:phage-related baseplate assembly family protein [Escherichia coli 4-203-08_S1_C3]